MANPSKAPRNIETTADDPTFHNPEKLSEKLDQGQGASDTDVHGDKGPKQFPEIIGDGIAACMRDRTAHMRVEQEMAEWVRNLPASQRDRVEKLREAREQIETAKLALEAFYLRFRSLAQTAKN